MFYRSRFQQLRIWSAGIACLTMLFFSAISSTRADAEELSKKELQSIGYRIVCESYLDGNWELVSMAADGSDPINLTKTPNFNELYPHVSPDGKKICFTADEGEGKSKVRNIYYMNIDGTGRKLIARNARQACWKADSSAIAYLKGEFEEFCIRDYATKGIMVYDLATGKHWEHPNKKIVHLYNLCWSPDGKWFFSTVHGGMGFRHGILAIEAEGTNVYDLGIPGCRPDVSPDGKKISWGASDWVIRVADLDFSGPRPQVKNQVDLITSKKPMKVYHTDWSPDGKYITFSRGPARKMLGRIPEIVGVNAKGWNLGVSSASRPGTWVEITTNGKSNKEPDWIPMERKP